MRRRTPPRVARDPPANPAGCLTRTCGRLGRPVLRVGLAAGRAAAHGSTCVAAAMRPAAPRAARRGLLLAAPVLLAGCGALARAALDLPAPSRAFLRPLGGIALDTAEWGFGGLSGAHLADDLTLTAVSDQGRWLALRLLLGTDGGLAGARLLRHGPLHDAAGHPLPRGRTADAEALVRLPDGSWLVAFERWHRIRRYRSLDGPALPEPAPPGIEAAPSNGGLEALARLADGRLLALAEQLPGEAPGSTAAWLGGPGAWRRLDYRPAPGFSPTDAVGFGAGALVLERRFSLLGGFACRLAHLARFDGPVLEGETWLDLPPDGPAENWEAVAAARHAGRGLLALLSDDNESLFQRSLLLLFESVTQPGR